MKTKISPILFSTPMVQAILDGRKTQTRRIVKPQPDEDLVISPKLSHQWDGKQDYLLTLTFCDENSCKPNIQCESCLPKYKIGDTLWVRETWAQWEGEFDPLNYAYKSDDFFRRYGAWERDTPNGVERIESWKPSIFMPRAAARIFLKVTNVRVERLQDISEEDAIAEGVIKDVPFYKDFEKTLIYRDYTGKTHGCTDAKSSFRTLWESINVPGSWDANPWVWVYEYEHIEKPENFLS